jgi:glycosyltransferase involved in cell wall biosynthesis
MSYSIILTIHNKDFLVRESLERIKKFTKGNFETIIVLDGCTDNSENYVKNFIRHNKNMKIKLEYADDVFEVKANNIGLKKAENEYVIIVQDDMLMNEDNWNVRLTTPFRVFDDVFAVSSNCSHNWISNPNSIHINMEENLDNCWSDVVKHVDHAGRVWGLPRDVFAIRQSVNRGPLAINHQDLQKMNYLDEEFAPLDMDDHDLCFRMKKTLNKVVGCYWTDFISNFSWGGTHNPSGGHKPWFYQANHKNSKLFLKRHVDLINGERIIENRIIK